MKILCVLIDNEGNTTNTIYKCLRYYSYYDGIPKKYIKYGSTDIDTNIPMYIVEKYDKYYIVAYTSTRGIITQLGYLPENVKILDEEYVKKERINKLNNKIKTFKI